MVGIKNVEDNKTKAAVAELRASPLFGQLMRVVAGNSQTLAEMLPALAASFPGIAGIVEREPEALMRALLPAAVEAAVFRSQKGAKAQMRRLPSLAFGEDASRSAQGPSVFVVPECEVSKPWLGFGGSFTEAAAVTLLKMSAERQEEVLNAYFHPDSGIRYNLGRLPIGSCDFGLGNWTCGELAEGDATLRGFSIAQYEKAILPMLIRANLIAGAPLRLLASPWTPPPWMKTSRRFDGDRRGRLRPECYGAWAFHFVRFIQEMGKVGVPIFAVSVQNEPEAAQTWESCLYTAQEERDFVRDHLGPALERAGLADVKIIVHDHNRGSMLERAAVIYGDPEAARYAWGVGYHWYGDVRFESWPDRCWVPFEDRRCEGSPVFELRAQVAFDNVRRVAELRPDKHVIFTEGCQELGGRPLSLLLDDWKSGERYSMNVIADLNAGCEGWIDWNLCVDEVGGPNHRGNFCLAPIVCDTETDQVLLQPAYWHLGHFSRYVQPGAKRVACSSSRDALEVTAFKNPSGSIVVVVLNQSEQDLDFWLKLSGMGAARTDAPRRSITTYVVER